MTEKQLIATTLGLARLTAQARADFDNGKFEAGTVEFIEPATIYLTLESQQYTAGSVTVVMSADEARHIIAMLNIALLADERIKADK